MILLLAAVLYAIGTLLLALAIRWLVQADRRTPIDDEAIPVHLWLPPVVLVLVASLTVAVVRLDPDIQFCQTSTTVEYDQNPGEGESRGITTTVSRNCSDLDTIETAILFLPALVLAAPMLDSAEFAGFKVSRRTRQSSAAAKETVSALKYEKANLLDFTIAIKAPTVEADDSATVSSEEES